MMKKPILLLVVRVLVAAALSSMVSLALGQVKAGSERRSCHPEASDLRVTYQPVEHTASGVYFLARLTLENRSPTCALGSSGWALYFNFVRQPLAVYPPAKPGDPPSLGDLARQELAAQGLSLTRADNKQSGDYYVLRPTPEFVPLAPGKTFAISLKVELWGILKTDSPAAWHIVFDGERARWVPAEAQLDPSDPKQTTAFSGDMNPVQTAAGRFAENTATLMQLSLAQRLLPQPLQVTEKPGILAIKAFIIIVQYPPTLQNEAKYLQAALQDVVLSWTRRAPSPTNRSMCTLMRRTIGGVTRSHRTPTGSN